MARAIRQGSLKSEEALEVHIAAIEATHGAINAVVARRFDEARLEARAADARIAAGDDDVGPLHGVPITIKEAFAVKGMPNTSGLVARRGTAADADATTVARLRAAGAVIMGVTNVSELCMWLESNNAVYGRTNNPYDGGRIAGGSSGGEGAVVGAGASPIGLGADIGGSIRLPAFFCGTFGHKPTGGLVPGTGQFPLAENAALRYLTTGPLARRAEDLMPFLRIIAGPDDRDALCYAMPLGDPDDVSLGDLAVVDVRSNGLSRVSDDLWSAQERVAAHLSSRGATVKRARLSSLKRSFAIWGSMMSEAADTSFAELMGEGRPIRPGLELLRWSMGRSKHTFAALGLALVEKIPLVNGRHGAEMVAHGKALQGELEDHIGDGVMLFPTFPSVAPRHNRPIFTFWRMAYTGIINVTELPSTAVPMGLDADGIPLGVQVVARRGNDHVCIAVAQELERAFGGWVPPPRLH